jgi:hypothetical protein
VAAVKAVKIVKAKSKAVVKKAPKPKPKPAVQSFGFTG